MGSTQIRRTKIEEIWKECFNGYYEVSNFGRVRRSSSKRILKPREFGRGYYSVKLYGCNIVEEPYIHTLVAEAFLGSRPDGTEINHKDLNRFNNKADNLEYITHSENIKHAAKHYMKTSKWGPAKLTLSQKEEVKFLYSQSKKKFADRETLAKKFNVSEYVIQNVVYSKEAQPCLQQSQIFKP